MRYPVLFLVVISLAGTIVALWAMAFGHLIAGLLVLAATFIILRVAVLRLTRAGARRRGPQGP